MSDRLYALRNRHKFLMAHGGVPRQEKKIEIDPADAAFNDLAKKIRELHDKSDQSKEAQIKRQVWEFKRTFPEAIAQGADRERMKGYAMEVRYFSPDRKFCIGIIRSGGRAPYIIDGVDGDEVF